MSRTGNRRELLRGPLSYGVVFVLATVVGWRSSVSSVFALVLLCVGDGFAELFGKAYGKGRILGSLPYNRKKTLAGTLAFVVFSWISMELLLALPQTQQHLVLPNFSPLERSLRIGGVCAVAALAESSTNSDWDNVIVYAAGAVAASIVF